MFKRPRLCTLTLQYIYISLAASANQQGEKGYASKMKTVADNCTLHFLCKKQAGSQLRFSATPVWLRIATCKDGVTAILESL